MFVRDFNFSVGVYDTMCISVTLLDTVCQKKRCRWISVRVSSNRVLIHLTEAFTKLREYDYYEAKLYYVMITLLEERGARRISKVRTLLG